MKYAKTKNQQIIIYPQLPRVYNGIVNFSKASKDVLQNNGFYPVIEPDYDSNTQKLDNIHFDDKQKAFVYDIVSLSAEEIELKETVEKKQRREELLKKGVVVSNFWFNESVLKSFINARDVIKEIGDNEIEWKDIYGNWVNVNLTDSLNIIAQAMNKIKQIYKDN